MCRGRKKNFGKLENYDVWEIEGGRKLLYTGGKGRLKQRALGAMFQVNKASFYIGLPGVWGGRICPPQKLGPL